MATGLMHPRIVYPLPNGDVLVVESNSPGTDTFRPKDYIQGKVKARAGAAAKGGDRITLLRDANGDGVPELKTVSSTTSISIWGALGGRHTVCRQHRRDHRLPFALGQTKITAPGTKLADLPAGPIDHHWTKSMVASPDGSKLYVGVGSNSNITENGMDAEQGRAAIYEVDRLTGAKRIYATGTRNPTNLAVQPGTGQLFAVVNERDEIGPDLGPGLSHRRSGTAASTAGPTATGANTLTARPSAETPLWSRRRSSPTMGSAHTLRRWVSASAKARRCRHGSPTVHSSANTEVGIAARSTATK